MRNIKNFMKLGKQFLAISTILALLLTAGCSALKLPESTKTSQIPVATSSNNVELAEEKIKGGELFIALPKEVKSFDPLEAKTEDMVNLLSLIYEQPLSYSNDGKLTENLISTFEVNEAKTEFVFHLRESIYFSDGTTNLTAKDIVYSANRVRTMNGGSIAPPVNPSQEQTASANPSNETAASPSETAEAANAGIVQPERSRYELYSEFVDTIEEIDPYTVKLTMNKAGNAGLHFMTFPVMNEALEKGEFPVGTGPYAAESYDADGEGKKHLVLIPNAHWRKTAPYIEKIVATSYSDEKSELEAVDSSLLDFITTDILNSENYKETGKTQVVDYMTNYYDCIVPNFNVSSLSDKNIRKAMSYAIDRRQVISTVLLNHAVPSDMPIAPDYYAYDAKFKVNDYDLGKSKELLAGAGYRTEKDGEGQTLTLNMIVEDDRDFSYRKEAAKAVAKQLSKVGIEVNIEKLPKEEYAKRLQDKNFELAYCSFYMDIAPNVEFMFRENGTSNFGNVRSEEINQAMDQNALAVGENETKIAMSNLQQQLADIMPQIGICYRMNSYICDEGIKGIMETRENMVFQNIQDWYYKHMTEMPPPSSESATQQENTTVTEPKNAQDNNTKIN